jgi:hypothetical protein
MKIFSDFKNLRFTDFSTVKFSDTRDDAQAPRGLPHQTLVSGLTFEHFKSEMSEYQT